MEAPSLGLLFLISILFFFSVHIHSIAVLPICFVRWIAVSWNANNNLKLLAWVNINTIRCIKWWQTKQSEKKKGISKCTKSFEDELLIDNSDNVHVPCPMQIIFATQTWMYTLVFQMNEYNVYLLAYIFIFGWHLHIFCAIFIGTNPFSGEKWNIWPIEWGILS